MTQKERLPPNTPDWFQARETQGPDRVPSIMQRKHFAANLIRFTLTAATPSLSAKWQRCPDFSKPAGLALCLRPWVANLAYQAGDFSQRGTQGTNSPAWERAPSDAPLLDFGDLRAARGGEGSKGAVHDRRLRSKKGLPMPLRLDKEAMFSKPRLRKGSPS